MHFKKRRDRENKKKTWRTRDYLPRIILTSRNRPAAPPARNTRPSGFGAQGEMDAGEDRGTDDKEDRGTKVENKDRVTEEQKKKGKEKDRGTDDKEDRGTEGQEKMGNDIAMDPHDLRLTCMNIPNL